MENNLFRKKNIEDILIRTDREIIGQQSIVYYLINVNNNKYDDRFIRGIKGGNISK